MSRGTEFVDLFNELSRELCKIASMPLEERFQVIVDAAVPKNAAAKFFATDLRAYGNLRNAIVHGTKEVLAEPTETTLRRFREIVEQVTKPRRLDSCIRSALRRFQPDEPLLDALRYMKQHKFSQVVIQTAHGPSLLSVEGVAQWLEQQAHIGLADLENALVGDALQHEPVGSFVILSRERSIYDARDAFFGALDSKHPRLFAVIITQSGKKTEKPLGIVTAWDIFDDARS